MSNWEDTVMSKEQMACETPQYDEPTQTLLQEQSERIAKAQAKISWDKAIRDVVEWIESVPTREIDGADQYTITLEQWQTFKKERGL